MVEEDKRMRNETRIVNEKLTEEMQAKRERERERLAAVSEEKGTQYWKVSREVPEARGRLQYAQTQVYCISTS